MKKLIYILILLFGGFNVNIFTQVIEFEIFTTSNSEIPDDNISCLAIDRYDNKWIAVDHGIASLNERMTHFVYDELTIDGSPYERYCINCIAIDNFDKLWIGTRAGLVDNNFEIYNSLYYPDCPINSGVNSIGIDSDNNVWILEDERLTKYDGNNWESFDTLNTIIPAIDFSVMTCISVDNEDNLWIGVSGREFFESGELIKFDGTFWTTFNLPDSVRILREITIDDEGNKWIATAGLGWGDTFGYGVIKLSADDSTWTVYNKSNSGLTSNAVWNISIDKFGNKWMATSPLIHQSDVGMGGGLVKFDGNEWTIYDSLNSGLPTKHIGCVLIDSKNNKWLDFGAHYGRGGQLAVFNENGIVTDVAKDAIIHNVPIEYILNQNYPNPFNPNTTIKYSIPKLSNAILKVFDVLGSEVVTLVNKEQPQGNYKVEFDGSDLTSGIYFYRLQAGDFIDVKKMILIK